MGEEWRSLMKWALEGEAEVSRYCKVGVGRRKVASGGMIT